MDYTPNKDLTIPEEFWRDDLDDREVMVSINCITYNHEKYIRDALEGFVNQKTNFRFEAIVHDDCSTDGTAAIIREYAEKYPSIIKPIFEKENQYSKKDGSLTRIVEAHLRGKYVAICEGDDYWTDPLKLQKQFDFMEKNPNHSLCFHAYYKRFNLDKKLIESHRYDRDIDCVPMNDMIIGGGAFMATCSMFYRGDKKINYSWLIHSPVGDCVTMLSLALNGFVGYLDEPMSCYRMQAENSWSIRVNKSIKTQLTHFSSVVKTWKEFDNFTNRKYHLTIQKKMFINRIGLIKRILVCLKRKWLGKLKFL